MGHEVAVTSDAGLCKAHFWQIDLFEHTTSGNSSVRLKKSPVSKKVMIKQKTKGLYRRQLCNKERPEARVHSSLFIHSSVGCFPIVIHYLPCIFPCIHDSSLTLPWFILMMFMLASHGKDNPGQGVRIPSTNHFSIPMFCWWISACDSKLGRINPCVLWNDQKGMLDR